MKGYVQVSARKALRVADRLETRAAQMEDEIRQEREAQRRQFEERRAALPWWRRWLEFPPDAADYDDCVVRFRRAVLEEDAADLRALALAAVGGDWIHLGPDLAAHLAEREEPFPAEGKKRELPADAPPREPFFS